ncbi:Trimeric LpxA-like [Phytophthora cactorum]|nr:Trimeric LpxA-like [Phytophthora cactorum]
MRKVTFELGRCVRETGQALDRLGLRVLNDNSFKEKFSRHRQVMALYDKRPKIAHDVWVAPNATVVGDVEICNDASVFYNVVIRGDLNQVRIGNRTNVQDRTVIHTASSTNPGLAPGANIGNDVTIGHGCTLYSCTIEHNALIGMGAIILDGALVDPTPSSRPAALCPQDAASRPDSSGLATRPSTCATSRTTRWPTSPSRPVSTRTSPAPTATSSSLTARPTWTPRRSRPLAATCRACQSSRALSSLLP